MKKNKINVSIVGTGGQSRVVIDICRSNNIDIDVLYENSSKILEKDQIIENYLIKDFIKNVKIDNKNLILAIGDIYEREKLFNQFNSNNNLINISHPSAILSNNIIQEHGNIICRGAIISTNVIIGKNNLINTGAIIEHEVNIKNNCNIGPGSKIGGRTVIGSNVNIGIGVSIIDKINIGNNVTIGAGSVVIDNLDSDSTYVGVPAKKIIK